MQHIVTSRFLDVVSGSPGRIAVYSGDSPLTYAELSLTAGGIQRLVAASGGHAGARVGLLLGHDASTIAAIMGTLLSGCAYVPLDPSYPAPRLAYMLGDADVAVLVTTRAHETLARTLLAGRHRPVVFVEDATPATPTATPVEPDGLAYLRYTSGSTGTPKGVAQSHRNLMHCVGNQVESLSITSGDRLSLLASVSFDASVPDIYPALLTGATLVPIDVRALGPGELVRRLADREVTVYHSTPTLYRYVLDALGPAGRLPSVRAVLLGGERVTRSDVTAGRGRFADACLFVNGYGATEATFVTHYRTTFDSPEFAPDAEPDAAPGTEPGAEPASGSGSPADPAAGPLVPIGRPLPGYETVLLNPDGDEGEIAVRSPHLALGYWRDPERTAERFTADDDGRRIYRTGDLGRRLPDGTLVCLGRLDRQIKVRGFRVEPAEVETHLTGRPGVARAVVTLHGDRLVAHVQPAEGAVLDPAALRRTAAETLPDHLVPAVIVVLDTMPLTPTGKVDVRALPAPGTARAGERPATPAETAVHDAWCDVLGVTRVGVTDPFFDAGGHSLLLGRLQQRLTDVLGTPVPMMALFEHTTVRAQARLLAAGPTTGPRTSGTGGPPTSGASGPGDLEGPGGPGDPGGPEEPADLGDLDKPGEFDEPGEFDDHIAVVGLGCRFPGAPDPAAFWSVLSEGVDAVHDYSDAELRELGIGTALLADPAHVRAGGRLDGVEDFDAEFFGFTPDEAARTDPQHRLFLETAWEALEDAGCDPDRFDGQIGVFTSTSANRYFLFHLFGNPAAGAPDDPDDWEGRILPHQRSDHLPGQVAYRFGLTGPAVAVQSACSSSLVAVCMAAQSLADHRCDLALAGGVTVTWPRHRHTPGGMVSPDGRCRAFDAAADGSGFSSGSGVVALKRLADAVADGDHVYAVIPGWAVGNDGAARAGFAVPGLTGQAATVAEALGDAGIPPDEIGMVEAHGSGTPLGDAIEVEALTRAFRAAGARGTGYCALGSVKTNIGHTDAASGIAGFIKAVLSVRHGKIPGNLHVGSPHPQLDLDRGPFHLPAKTTDWPDGRRRVAGVSAIGIGGTGAHVLVAEAPPRPPAPAPAPGARYLLPVSARSPRALRAAIARLRDHLAADPELRIADVAHTLTAGRRSFAHRVVVECRDLAEAITALDPDRLPSSAGTPEAPPSGSAAPGRRIPLPTYPFQRQRHWIDPPGGTR
ncbi:amino acid adenylation protein [Planomonospora sphaerica]|uniref:Amino acid adenylation protein n=1 Tax=Planomonospora sphaerica TaxID=161355 RepID=A0A171DQF6_9ACTN|nr:beta-ketoacyl synthase N-terminal-like domain-containing protein [Planomonospora sphaerica]GAT71298.1 amino acid adenylation protein [Planomonospora sphaerica]